MGLSRRTVILGMTGLAVSACTTVENEPPRSTTTPPPTTAAMKSVVNTKLTSKARGREVTVITMAPDGHNPDDLPKCVALHGRGEDASWMVRLDVQKSLTQVVRAGVKPFAVVAVDGGPETYWVDGKPGDNPQKMLLEELGPIQAAFGISMGAFGALRFARTRKDLKAVVAISPALFRDWPTAKSKRVFADQAHWEANEPLRHTNDLAGVPLGVWCGAGDTFITVAKALINQTNPAKSVITPGGHTADYWKPIMPEVLTFIGERISATA
ncbi:alpha/beta hydrolase family protein [Kibdelosporangium aridum]|nr:esterase [Kibdelosporangium aridum]